MKEPDYVWVSFTPLVFDTNGRMHYETYKFLMEGKKIFHQVHEFCWQSAGMIGLRLYEWLRLVLGFGSVLFGCTIDLSVLTLVVGAKSFGEIMASRIEYIWMVMSYDWNYAIVLAKELHEDELVACGATGARHLCDKCCTLSITTRSKRTITRSIKFNLGVNHAGLSTDANHIILLINLTKL